MIDLSEVLWKSKREAASTLASAAPVTQAKGFSDLRHVPVEEADIPESSRVVVHSDAQSPGADRFRYLRMRLQEARELTRLRSLLVTSPLPEDGKSSIALNLATALAEKGKRKVLLIDGDLHRPTAAERLGIQSRAGLAECLEEGLNPMSALRYIEPLKIYLLQAGSPKGNPSDILQSDVLSDITGALTPHFDWVVVDTPPVVPLTDTLTIGRCVDTCLLVVRAERTPQEEIKEAINRLGAKHVLGIILNGAERLNRLYSQYYGYYAKTKS